MANRITSKDPFGMSPLWEAFFDIYEIFAGICHRHGLRYYAMGGTLLGAVRHHGFIPWDDDFDLAMPRADYEKFREIAKAELPAHLKWMDHRNTPEFTGQFAKVMDCRRERIEALERMVGHKLSNGLFIDIFPIDGYYQTGVALLIRKMKEFVCESVARFATRKGRPRAKTFKGSLSTFAGGVMFPFCPWLWSARSRTNHVEGIFRGVPFDEGRQSGMNGVNRGSVQMILPPRTFCSGKVVPFEGIVIPIPDDAHACLVQNYDENYMTPPPESQRRPTHEKVDHYPWWLGPTS